MKVEKTGAVVFLREHRVFVICDVHVIDHVHILRANPTVYTENPRDTVYAHVEHVDQWWKTMGGTETIVTTSLIKVAE